MKKVLIAVLMLAGLGGLGFGGWWFFIDAEPRNLRELNGFQEEESTAAWEWVASHGDRPVVKKAIGEQLHSMIDDASVGGAPDQWRQKRFGQVTLVFARTPITEPELARQAMIIWARFDYAPAFGWAKDPAVLTHALVAALEDLPAAFRSSDHPNLPLAHSETAHLLEALDQRGVKADSETLVRGVVQCWLRFRAPAARAGFENARSAHPAAFQQALIGRLINGTSYSQNEPDEDEVSILMDELGAMKPERTTELLLALARLSKKKATPRIFETWGPASVEELRSARTGFSSYDQTEADELLARLGSFEPGAVQRKVDSLSAWLQGEPVSGQKYDDEFLSTLTSCSHEFHSRLSDIVPRVIGELAQMPMVALLDTFKNSRDVVTLHLVSRAIASVDPEALTSALEPRWAEFAPAARAAEAARLRASRLDPAALIGYRDLAPRLWEGLAAMQELPKPSPAALRHLWPAVSSPSGQLSRTAVALLDANLTDDEFVVGLFGYFDLRSSYSVDEVNGWTELMSKRQKSHRLLGRLMGRLLDAVGGKPENLPMVHKVVGLSALSKSTCDCAAVLQRFAADTGSYERTRFKEDSQGVVSDRTSTTERFADLAKAALSR